MKPKANDLKRWLYEEACSYWNNCDKLLEKFRKEEGAEQ